MERMRAEMQKGLDDFAAGRVAELSAFRLELEKEGRIKPSKTVSQPRKRVLPLLGAGSIQIIDMKAVLK